MCFTQEPLPEILSKQTLARYGPGAPFRHRSVVRDWVEKIFTRGGHDKLVEFNTTVEKAEKQDDKWILTLRKESPGQKTDYWWQESFDAVVVASGHYNIPYIPNIPGLAEYEDRYPGTIRHSKHFGLASAYQDKVSGCNDRRRSEFDGDNRKLLLSEARFQPLMLFMILDSSPRVLSSRRCKSLCQHLDGHLSHTQISRSDRQSCESIQITKLSSLLTDIL